MNKSTGHHHLSVVCRGKRFFGTDYSELLIILLFPGFRNYVCVGMLIRVRFVVPLSGVWSVWVSYAYKRQIVSPVGEEGYIAVQKSSIAVARK
jgi:hypothetical protein